MSGCPGTSATAYENCGAPAQGLQPYGAIGNGTLSAWIAAAVAQSKPAGAPSGYAVVCEAMLRARGLIYYKQNPGDCGSAGAVPGVLSPPQLVGLSGTAAGGAVAGLGAAGVLAGPATLGISTAISVGVAALEGIFAHHDQAVANEQATICAVANYFNPIMRQLDAAVKSGAISSDTGITNLQQVILTAKNGLVWIIKSCDAACVYAGILQAHLYFAKNYYPSLAPANNIYPQAPANPPDGVGTPPGGVTVTGTTPPPPPPVRSLPSNTYAPAGPSVGNGTGNGLTSNNQLPGNPLAPDNLNAGYNQQTGQSAQAADVPNVPIDWTMIGAIVAIIALLVLVAHQ